MNVPDLDCKIKMQCTVHLSEDPDKVMDAVTNIFPDCTVNDENLSIRATSDNIKSLEKIRESVQSRQLQKTYRRTLEKHLDGNSTWIYLNKQAAFVKKVAICEDADESPLGPIKVVLTSRNITGVIEWLAAQKTRDLIRN